MNTLDFYVYAHRRLSTGAAFYVGKGSFRRAYSDKSRNAHWKNIVAKDGGHKVDILISGLDEELSFLAEIEAIDKFRKLGVALVNMTTGGDGIPGHVMSEESKAKMRARKTSLESRAKQRAAKLGKTFSDERKAAISARMKADPRIKGRVPPSRKGGTHTEEAKAKMSAAKKGRASHNKGGKMPDHVKEILTKAQASRTNFAISEETRRKISEAQIGRKHSKERVDRASEARSRAVICVDTGIVYKNALEAARSCGIGYKTSVWECCAGKRESAHGKIFKYLGAPENGR